MSRSTSIVLRLLASGALVVATTTGAAATALRILPADDAPAAGLLVDGAPLPAGSSLRGFVLKKAAEHESAKVQVHLPGRSHPVTMTLAELGVRPDVELAVQRAMAIGHVGSIEQRLEESLRARQGRIDVPITWSVEASALFKWLEPIKEDTDEPPLPARLDLNKHTVIPHRSGKYLDLYEAVEAVDRVARLGAPELRLPPVEVPPVASSEFLEKIDITQVVGHFETRFGYLGGEANRAQNIATAASRLDGFVLLPGQIMSFNAVVGHRTLENGFAKGWEIFKGEMVEGIGGGTCQVASTLHAASYLAGLEVIERSPHSRPSGYITMGLDSTVVDGSVDLKLRNPFSFPVVLHSKVDHGVITFELLGQQRPVMVTFKRDVLGVRDYKRQVRETGYLPAGKIVLKQHGIRGYSIRRTRVMKFRDGTEHEEITTDIYPATAEIYLVPPGTDESVLPPLPGETKDPPADAQPASSAAPVEIVLAPGVHRPSAEQAGAPGRLVITR
ncbi:MAG: VanW family protein [Deltaproteobacteria bacterium]|nr:VanW family protein [Deltaproteobacteria bacterium]